MENLLGFFIIAIVLWLVVLGIQKKKKRDKALIDALTIKRLTKTNSTSRQFGKTIEDVIFRAMENAHIVFESNKVATVESRLNFFHDVLCNLEIYAKFNSYSSQMDKAEEMYSQAYYDKPLTDEQKDVIKNPLLYLNEWKFYSDKWIVQAFLRYALVQQNFINALKTKKGKMNRQQLVIDEAEKLLLATSNLEFKKMLSNTIDYLKVERDKL